MRAVVIAKFGGPEVLEVRDVPMPAPRPREVLVRVHATALNRADLLQRQGKYPAPPDSPQDIPGMEFAGEVVEAGPNASRWTVGSRVFGIVGGGAYAQFLTTHEEAVVEIPAGLSWTDAAAIPEAFVTAHDALVTQAGMRAGDMVLIHAVASGVGLAGVQLARAWGAKPFGTTRSAEKLANAVALGLVDGLVLTKDLAPLQPAVATWTGSKGIDVTLELVGGAYLTASINAAAPRGRIMLVGTMGGATAEIPLGVVLRKRLAIRGTVFRSRSITEKIDATTRFAREVVPLFASGVLRPTVDRVLRLDQVVEAHRLVESNATAGKVVLEVE